MIGAFIVEMVCTFFFIAIILMVKDPITAPSKEGYLCCWTVGVTLLGQICCAGGRSGAALNPAVGLSINIFDNWQLQTSNYFQYMWIYTCGPYMGGAIAGLFHHYQKWSTVRVLGHETEENVAAVIYDK
jgi:glycerol uptake facilitator-like aquaporin